MREVATPAFLDPIIQCIDERSSLPLDVRTLLLQYLQNWRYLAKARPNDVPYLLTAVEQLGQRTELPPPDPTVVTAAQALTDTRIAPDWVDSDVCMRCRTAFGTFVRKHHCRNCGRVFCYQCSSKTMPLPWFSMETPVRVCDGCFQRRKPMPLPEPAPHPTSASPAPQPRRTAEQQEEEELRRAIELSLQEAAAQQQRGNAQRQPEGLDANADASWTPPAWSGAPAAETAAPGAPPPAHAAYAVPTLSYAGSSAPPSMPSMPSMPGLPAAAPGGPADATTPSWPHASAPTWPPATAGAASAGTRSAYSPASGAAFLEPSAPLAPEGAASSAAPGRYAPPARASPAPSAPQLATPLAAAPQPPAAPALSTAPAPSGPLRSQLGRPAKVQSSDYDHILTFHQTVTRSDAPWRTSRPAQSGVPRPIQNMQDKAAASRATVVRQLELSQRRLRELTQLQHTLSRALRVYDQHLDARLGAPSGQHVGAPADRSSAPDERDVAPDERDAASVQIPTAPSMPDAPAHAPREAGRATHDTHARGHEAHAAEDSPLIDL